MRIRLDSLLTNYNKGVKNIEIDAGSIREVIDKLDKLYPGIKFRFIDELDIIRPHMNLFLNKVQIREIDISTNPEDELFIVQSLGGG